MNLVVHGNNNGYHGLSIPQCRKDELPFFQIIVADSKVTRNTVSAHLGQIQLSVTDRMLYGIYPIIQDLSFFAPLGKTAADLIHNPSLRSVDHGLMLFQISNQGSHLVNIMTELLNHPLKIRDMIIGKALDFVSLGNLHFFCFQGFLKHGILDVQTLVLILQILQHDFFGKQGIQGFHRLLVAAQIPLAAVAVDKGLKVLLHSPILLTKVFIHAKQVKKCIDILPAKRTFKTLIKII